MTTSPVPLNDLEQNIQDQKAALEQMQSELKLRQAYIRDLERKKQTLEKELAGVERDIELIKAGEKNPPGFTKPKAPTKKPEPKSTATKPGPTTLPKSTGEGTPTGISKMVLDVVGSGKGPMPTAEIVDGVLSNDLPTKSKDPRRMIQKKIYELVKRGLLTKVEEGLYDLPGETSSDNPETSTSAPKGVSSSNGTTAAKPTGSASKPKPAAPPSLKVVIIEVLKMSRKPLSTAEIAERVLERGYETTSKDFKKVIATQIKKMDEVEMGEENSGYKLKGR
ncbi:MAG: hypothetical protein ACFCD0_01745 [Gemmataceae bacterium]